MKRDIKIGFVGLGFIGTIHSTACFAMPLIFRNLPFQVRFGKVCKNNIDEIPQFYEGGVKAIDELLQDKSLNAIDICTPNYLHAMQAKEVIENGFNVYLEKPIGLNGNEAYDIMKAAKDKGIINQTALMYRFMPAVNQARDMINNGEIGKILYFKSMMLHSGYLDSKRPMSWKMRFKTSGGGAIIDLGIHLIDTIRFVLGEVKSVDAISKTYFQKRPKSSESEEYEDVDVDDWTGTYLEMGNGAWGIVETSRISANIDEETRFEIYGTKGSIIVTTKMPRYAKLYKKEDNIVIQGKYKDESDFSKYVDTIYPSEKYSLGWMVDMHMASLMNFFMNINEGKVIHKETPTFEEAYKSQIIIDKIIDKSRNK